MLKKTPILLEKIEFIFMSVPLESQYNIYSVVLKFVLKTERKISIKRKEKL